ncbi:glutaredoxin family protein [Patescibacteria group bacterium]
MPKIKIYSTQFCGYCKLLKQYLEEKKISFVEVNVSQDETAQKEMITKSGQQGVPVTIIENDGKEEIIVGFDKNKIDKILKIKK